MVRVGDGEGKGVISAREWGKVTDRSRDETLKQVREASKHTCCLAVLCALQKSAVPLSLPPPFPSPSFPGVDSQNTPEYTSCM